MMKMKIVCALVVYMAACTPQVSTDLVDVEGALTEERSVTVPVVYDDPGLPNQWNSSPWTGSGPDSQGCRASLDGSPVVHHAYCVSDYWYNHGGTLYDHLQNNAWFGCANYAGCATPTGLEENWYTDVVVWYVPSAEWSAILGITRVDIEADVRAYPAGETLCLRPKFPVAGWVADDRCTCADVNCAGDPATMTWPLLFLTEQSKDAFAGSLVVGLKLGGPVPDQATPGPVPSLAQWLHGLQVGVVRVKVYYRVPAGTPGH